VNRDEPYCPKSVATMQMRSFNRFRARLPVYLRDIKARPLWLPMFMLGRILIFETNLCEYLAAAICEAAWTYRRPNCPLRTRSKGCCRSDPAHGALAGVSSPCRST
jgi:hypothetical protein